MFHSRRWRDQLEAQPANAVLGLPCGHWVMLDQPEPLHTAILQWLALPPAL
jgi:pimeloyl-ACP methyl ester carboxylesterase